MCQSPGIVFTNDHRSYWYLMVYLESRHFRYRKEYIRIIEAIQLNTLDIFLSIYINIPLINISFERNKNTFRNGSSASF